MGLNKERQRTVPLEAYNFKVKTWTNPLAATANRVHAAITGNSASTTSVTTSITDPDFPRNITITPGGTTAGVAACNITIAGTDIEGQSITEAIAMVENQSTISTASVAFKTVTSITIPPQDGDAATFTIGIGNKLGLDRKLHANTVVIANCAAAYETTRPTVAVSSSTISNNTITFNTAPDGAKDYEILYYYTSLDSNPQ